jgi:uncharacterized protein YbjT (DUF2867 family)
VIGGSGFVGGETVATLEQTGEHITAPHHHRAASHPPVAFDWSDKLTLLLDDQDIGTVAFAATVEQGYDQPIEAFERAAARVLDACEDRRFVSVSSDSVSEGVNAPTPRTTPSSSPAS